MIASPIALEANGLINMQMSLIKLDLNNNFIYVAGYGFFPFSYIESETKFDRSYKSGNEHFRLAVEILLKTRENAAPKFGFFTTDDKIDVYVLKIGEHWI